jgi:hypothetical protein
VTTASAATFLKADVVRVAGVGEATHEERALQLRTREEPAVRRVNAQ